MKKIKESPSDYTPVKDTVKIPVYSSIKLVNGEFVGELKDYIETPFELVSKGKEHS